MTTVSPSAAAPDAETVAGDRSPLDRLLRPRSVAIVGASADPASWSGATIGNLRDLGFPGAIYPVNPRRDEIAGLPCYPDVAAIPDPVDAALLFVPRAAVPEVLAQCGARGVGGAVILAGGYGETGAAGAAEEADLRAIADRHGLAICGPNCMGFVNLADRFMGYVAACLPPDMRAGRTGLVSQSGQLAAMMFVRCHDQGVRLRYLVSTGNELNMEAADWAEAMLADPEIRSVGMILEGLRTPAGFLALAARARAAGRPLIVHKMGRSRAAARTAMAHTGKLAGSARAYDAVFRQEGVVAVDDPLEIPDVASLFDRCPPPRGDRVGVVSFSGGWCGTLADQAEALGVPLAEFAPETVDRLRPVMELTPPVNPLDLSGQVTTNPERWPQAIRAVHDDPNTDIVVVFVHQVRPAWRERFIPPVLAVARDATKPLVVLYDGGKPVEAGYEQIVADGGVPVFRYTQPMLKAIRRFADWHLRPARPAPEPAAGPDPSIAVELGRWDGMVPEHAAKAALARFGLPVVAERLATTPEEAVAAAEAIGWPVALKGVASDLAHKTEAGLVRLALPGAEALRTAHAEMGTLLDGHRLGAAPAACLVQAMAPRGVEAILGLHRDPDFGPMILLGPGGTLTELVDDVSLRRAPLTEHDVEEMIDETRLGRLLAGLRGAPAADRGALVQAVLALSRYALAAGDDVQSVDVNPLIVHPGGAVAVDALIVRAAP